MSDDRSIVQHDRSAVQPATDSSWPGARERVHNEIKDIANMMEENHKEFQKGYLTLCESIDYEHRLGFAIKRLGGLLALCQEERVRCTDKDDRTD